ncbi:MAG TPA: class I SAM-dependent methyltransferase [Chloroflexia bacterium]|nr:class I SAM-dependent methyltransferase [Chloroflexia bacterium]
MRHFHPSSPSASAPQTSGIVLHGATMYERTTGPLLSRTDAGLIRLAGIKPGMAVLEAGCGPGRLSIEASKVSGPTGRVCGLDASPEMIDLARTRARKAGVEVEFTLGVIEKLPYPDETFDVVLSRLVIHHLPGDLKRQGFAEMRRVLKPGGQCLIIDFDPTRTFLVRAANKLRLLPFPAPMRQINPRAYLALLTEAGFKEVESGPSGYPLLSYVRGKR